MEIGVWWSIVWNTYGAGGPFFWSARRFFACALVHAQFFFKFIILAFEVRAQKQVLPEVVDCIRVTMMGGRGNLCRL